MANKFFDKIAKFIPAPVIKFLSILFVDKREDDEQMSDGDVLKEIVDVFIFVLVALIIVRFFFFEIRYIPSESMVPTLKIGDRLIVERYSRFYSTPKRGDIMVFYPPETELSNNPWALFTRYTGFWNKDIAYIKRVIGTPGDKIEVEQSQKKDDLAVYINGVELDEPYINPETEYTPCGDENAYCSVTLGKGQYFMMGDNRGNSKDSRVWGTLDEKRFIGRALFRIWPPSKTGMFRTPEYNTDK